MDKAVFLGTPSEALENLPKIGNAFSIQMIDFGNADSVLARFAKIDTEILKGKTFISAIGHTDTAAVVADILQTEIEAARINLTLGVGDILFVAQVVGGRLPEGTTTLPAGFELKFFKVEILEDTL